MSKMAEKNFFVWSTSGIGYNVLLDSLEKNPDVVCDLIQKQLPQCYSTEIFKVICQGKDLRNFHIFPQGIGHYLSALSGATQERVYVFGRPWPE